MTVSGSSPRVRGTASGNTSNSDIGRFIPACAGNSGRCPHDNRWTTVHPRVCGEQLLSSCGDARGCGSSPRVRGTDRCRETAHDVDRFIPACAGNRFSRHLIRPGSPVHPRVCGEQLRFCLSTGTSRGSSPRVRGTGVIIPRYSALPRFIPACAGNRKQLPGTVTVPPVHPRVCGEQGCTATTQPEESGSSPRVRGTVSVAIRSAAS